MSFVSAIMAGGLGKRMKTSIPKVLNLVNNKPMICHVITKALVIGSQYVLIIVGKYKNEIKTVIDSEFLPDQLSKIVYIDQMEPLGTGHAIKCCIDFFITNDIDKNTNVLILSGDVPLIKTETIETLITQKNSLLITRLDNPKGCGRIVFDKVYGSIEKIIEEKDCNDKEREIKYVNCGIYNLTVGTILNYIPLIKNENKSAEYYLTDIIDLLYVVDSPMRIIELPKERQFEIININTPEDLNEANNMKN
jgi:bifunctional UDP-N-acetylglucosamine pyrophosphorylase/glucosamine-1-phosphate N-acetyltransferase